VIGVGGSNLTRSVLPLLAGASVSLSAEVRDSADRPLASYAPVQLASRNPTVLQVDTTGRATAVGAGVTYVVGVARGARGTLADSVRVVVEARAPTVLAAGYSHTCGLTRSGAAMCWGSNLSGQLGDGSTGNSTRTPVAVAGGRTFAAISAGQTHTCALTTAGRAYCWGDNTNGELGDGTTAPRATPTPVAEGLTFARVWAGRFATCALTAAGAAYCWGLSVASTVGGGTNSAPATLTPAPVAGGPTFATLGMGLGFTCGLTPAGATFCWGSSTRGQAGALAATVPVPTAVAGAPAFVSLAVGGYHACGLTAAGVAYCWGWDLFGQLGAGRPPFAGTRLGDGTPVDSGHPQPGAVLGGVAFASLDAGEMFTCGLTAAGAAYCWGYNNAGQLGAGPVPHQPVPTPALGGLTFARIVLGGLHVCGFATGGALYCWGGGLWGETGLTGSRNVPTQVPWAS
jgi:alpha-tubulin suppressor-like RCC1 family protein